jgi:hypothetical protein
MTPKKSIFDDELEAPELNQGEKNDLSKEAYKEALKEVYKEKIKTQRSEKDIPDQGKLEGIREEKKEIARKQQVVKEKIENLAKQQELFLFKANSFFPFDLFPDTLLVDATKVTIISKEFFATEQINVVHIKDIFRAEVETSLFLANLIITFIHVPLRERMFLRIDKLKRADALKAKSIIDGLVLATAQGVDLSVLRYEEVMDLLQKLVKYKPVSAYKEAQSVL